MKTLKGLQEPLRALDGMPLADERGQPSLLKGLLANALARGRSKDPVRAMDVALQLHHATGDLELEDADSEILWEAIEADQQLTNLGRALALVCKNGQEGKLPSA